MTTRSGFTGLITGFITSIFLFTIFTAFPQGFSSPTWPWMLAAGIFVIVITAGGYWAVRWSGSVQSWRCRVLGALSGGLAGMISYCLWGAAAAGVRGWDQAGSIDGVVRSALAMFLGLLLIGSLSGTFGGWLACRRRPAGKDVFDKVLPQMAMNVSIAAVPASIVAAVFAAVLRSKLLLTSGSQPMTTTFPVSFADLPLLLALLLVLISHLALTLVVPHETEQSEHRTGMNEVMMAAFVSIAAAPVLVFLFLLVSPDCFSNPFVVISISVSVVMSLASLFILFRRVLPKRLSLPAPVGEGQKTQARWFGTIAVSKAARLAKLCAGCGLAMVLPLYSCVISVLINLDPVSTKQLDSTAPKQLFLTHALASLGLSLAVIGVLILMYLFYLNLGRLFYKRVR